MSFVKLICLNSGYSFIHRLFGRFYLCFWLGVLESFCWHLLSLLYIVLLLLLLLWLWIMIQTPLFSWFLVNTEWKLIHLVSSWFSLGRYLFSDTSSLPPRTWVALVVVRRWRGLLMKFPTNWHIKILRTRMRFIILLDFLQLFLEVS